MIALRSDMATQALRKLQVGEDARGRHKSCMKRLKRAVMDAELAATAVFD